jgi:O-antigen/teichoic acid export membrane protein
VNSSQHPADLERIDAPHLFSAGALAVTWKLLGALLFVAVNGLVTRLLEPAAAGTYFVLTSVVIVLATVAGLGANQAVVRFVAEAMSSGDRAAAGRWATVGLIVTLVGSGILLMGGSTGLLGLALEGLMSTPGARALSLSVGALGAVLVLQRFASEVIRGLNRIGWASFLGGTTHGGLVSLVAAAAPLGAAVLARRSLTLPQVLAILIASVLPVLLLAAAIAARELDWSTRVAGRDDFGCFHRVSISLALWSWIQLVTAHGDLILLGALSPAAETALYGAAARLLTVAIFPLTVVAAVVPPTLVDLHVREQRSNLGVVLRASATVAGFPALLVLVVLVLFGPAVLALVYGDFFAGGAWLLTVLAVGQAVAVWAGVSSLVLIMTGNEKTLLAISCAAALVFVIATPLAGAAYGAYGVAVATTFSRVMQHGLTVLACRRRLGLWPQMELHPHRAIALCRRFSRELRSAAGSLRLD